MHLAVSHRPSLSHTHMHTHIRDTCPVKQHKTKFGSVIDRLHSNFSSFAIRPQRNYHLTSETEKKGKKIDDYRVL